MATGGGGAQSDDIVAGLPLEVEKAGVDGIGALEGVVHGEKRGRGRGKRAGGGGADE
jgi:hypothetical protein